jgi:hypothetical protein
VTIFVRKINVDNAVTCDLVFKNICGVNTGDPKSEVLKNIK